MTSRTKVKLDTFNKVLSALARVKDKSYADLVNKHLLQVVVGAKGESGRTVHGLVHLTKKTTEQRILSDMKRPTGHPPIEMAFALAIQSLTKRGEQISTGSIQRVANLIVQARIKSRAFIAASWLHSARKLAPFVPGHTLTRLMDGKIPMYYGGHADRTARAIPAREGQKIFTATVYNTSPSHPNNVRDGGSDGAAKVARAAINRALGNAILDMRKGILIANGQMEARARAKALGASPAAINRK